MSKQYRVFSPSKRPIITGPCSDNHSELCIIGDDVEISDGYHTMHELYQHRMMLFVALCNVCTSSEWEINAWKSKKHSDGTMFEPGISGPYFVMGLDTKKGNQINYHLPIKKYWDLAARVEELEYAPEYDNHTSDDVLTRLAGY